MAGLKLEHVRKVYDGGNVAVHDFSMEINDKEFIVFVGPSGCGKSTTLRMIAGLEDITGGNCSIDDKVVNDVSPRDRDIAMVFQNYALYPHMSVYDNMAFALKLRKMPKSEIKERVEKAAAILDITEYLKRKPKALSGGQRQRVAIGRAIVREPKVFLMDEPLSNLDAKLRNQMRAEIITLRKEIDTTFIYVTHDQTEAMTLGDRIVVMKDGWIQQIGTPWEVYNNPYNVFVAGFIGSPQMNFFDAKLVKTGDTYEVEVLGAKYQLEHFANVALLAKGVESKDVKLGIRPEHLEIEGGSGSDKVLAKVAVSEMMGSEMILHANVGDDKVTIKIISPKQLEDYEKSVAKGDDATSFRLMTDKIHLFDKETEVNLIADKPTQPTGPEV